MPYVMKLICYAIGASSLYDEEYLKSYDAKYIPPDGKYDGGRLETTLNIEEAQKFDNPTEVMNKWKETAPVPWNIRLDGKPNRPLTAFTIEVMEYSKANQTVWKFR